MVDSTLTLSQQWPGQKTKQMMTILIAKVVKEWLPLTTEAARVGWDDNCRTPLVAP